MSRFKFLNASYLKIIAMIAMVFDHIGAIILYHYTINDIGSIAAELYFPFRIIGRLSFLIFGFLIIDGVIHTKNIIKYLLQLLGLSIFITLGELIFTQSYSGNAITTLFLGALTIYLLRLDKWKKTFAIIPLGYVILCDLSILPMKCEYGIYGYLFILGCYLCYLLSKYYLKFYYQKNNLIEETFLTGEVINNYRVIATIIFIVSYNLVWYFIYPTWNGMPLIDMNLQSYSIITILPIFFYNGKRGFNNKWFKYGCYIFFPVHLIIIYLISLIIIR